LFVFLFMRLMMMNFFDFMVFLFFMMNYSRFLMMFFMMLFMLMLSRRSFFRQMSICWRLNFFIVSSLRLSAFRRRNSFPFVLIFKRYALYVSLIKIEIKWNRLKVGFTYFFNRFKVLISVIIDVLGLVS
jgi:hypothetical protein